jgi:hypothetical protein
MPNDQNQSNMASRVLAALLADDSPAHVASCLRTNAEYALARRCPAAAVLQRALANALDPEGSVWPWEEREDAD